MARQTTIQCPNCRMPVPAMLETVMDVGNDPDAKTRLLSGRVNTARCPNCGATAAMASPILYHDGSRELLLSFVPMELGLTKDASEKVIGDLMRELTGKLPANAMRGYMFNPRQMFTMQGIIDTVLQADGITPEMMETQKARVRLIETLLATEPEALEALIQERDADIDASFVQTLTVMAQRMAEEGRMDIAQAMMMLQEVIVQYSSFGQVLIEQQAQQQEIVRQMADEINALGQTANRADFLNLALLYAEDDQRLQALVGLVRPAFDDTFFQEMTLRIGQAPAEERDRYEIVRDKLTQLIGLVDQQAQMAMQEALALLQAIATSPDPDQMIADNLPLLDDAFMNVLAANIQNAEQRADIQTSAKLKDIYNRVVTALRSTMQPELQFINELLSQPSPDAARAMIQSDAGQYGDALMQMFDAVGQVMAQRGEDAILERLAFLRAESALVLGFQG